MTRRTAAQTAKAPAEATTTAPAPLALSVRRSEGVKKAKREREFNPTEEAVLASANGEGALAFDVATEQDADRVLSLLQRAASDNKLGMSKSKTQNADGSWTVDFEAKNEKRARKYTNVDIRTWAAANGWGEVSGPIPKELRDAYKVANGFAKNTVEENNNQG